MLISNLCSTLSDGACILGCVIAIIALVYAIMIHSKLKKQQDEGNATGDYEKLKLLIETQGAGLSKNNEMLVRSISTSNQQLLNYLQNVLQTQSQSTQGVENRINKLLSETEIRLNRIDDNLKNALSALQADNAKKLEEMRLTVDEKLNVSLERRLNDSFQLISDRLDKVHRGLGEMQELATGVGDLKRVLTNVKTRGVWGEIGLGNILSEMLAPNQFAKEVPTKPGSLERVDYVVLLPGKNDEHIYLPIDSKFPIEDYQRLLDASDKAIIADVEKAKTALYKRVKDEAKKIREKYIAPPKTTDFAVLYLALEGLYAEVIKNDELVQQLQRDYRIVICGPTTLSALINSLQMGFKTVAIEKRSSEIWSLLANFKTEFSKFGDLLSKTQKKLSEATGTIEDATKKTQKIQKKLNNIGLLEGEEDNTIMIESEDEDE